MFIEVERYGDSGSYTDYIMFSNSSYDTESLLKEFVTKYNIISHKKESGNFPNDGNLKIDKYGISNIRYSEYHTVPDLFVEFLKLKGFKRLSTTKVYFSD